MKPRIIKTTHDYEELLAETERLVALDPKQGTAEANSLELLAMLVEQYEKQVFPVDLPDPVAAIRFRMEQQGLAQRDLATYIGSASKVSEVLARKRPLTLSMIRALHEGLRMPAKVLLQEPAPIEESLQLDWDKFPVREMFRRGWIPELPTKGASVAPFIEEFFAPVGGPAAVPALFRGTLHRRSSKRISVEGLAAWVGRVLHKVLAAPPPVPFDRERLGDGFLTELAQLSWSDRGPLLAEEFLVKRGIAFVVEQHLPRTLLDGAALLTKAGIPVIAVTLRHDRLDNFWFTVLHEAAHVANHLDTPGTSFLDDLELDSDSDPELEADRLARDAAIPRQIWRRSDAFRRRTPDSIEALAKELRLHPAIIAGRIRRDAKNYRILSQMVGHGEVRKLFDEVRWD